MEVMAVEVQFGRDGSVFLPREVYINDSGGE